jgi:hypothetical protein
MSYSTDQTSWLDQVDRWEDESQIEKKHKAPPRCSTVSAGSVRTFDSLEKIAPSPTKRDCCTSVAKPCTAYSRADTRSVQRMRNSYMHASARDTAATYDKPECRLVC